MRHAPDCGTGAGLMACDCGIEPYIAYHAIPVLEKTGQSGFDEGHVIRWYRVVRWVELGTATSMEHAKRKFGGYPVLEHIRLH